MQIQVKRKKKLQKKSTLTHLSALCACYHDDDVSISYHDSISDNDDDVLSINYQ